jgi:uncharacterized protein (TIRG00374 family)
VALAAALPGLTTRRALTLSLTGSAVANVLPLGGAAGVGLNYAMTRRWGFSAQGFAAYTALTNIWDVTSKLTIVTVAGVILLGTDQIRLLHYGLGTVLAALVALPLLIGFLLHRPSAASLGGVLDRAISAGGSLFGRQLRSNLRSQLPYLSQRIVRLAVEKWRRLTVGSLGYACLQISLLWACMHAIGLDLDATTLTVAFAVDRLLTLLPLTPGGAAVVEAGMVAALTSLGVAPAPAVAGVVLYRSFTFLAEIPVGGVAALIWLFPNGQPARLRKSTRLAAVGSAIR